MGGLFWISFSRVRFVVGVRFLVGGLEGVRFRLVVVFGFLFFYFF